MIINRLQHNSPAGHNCFDGDGARVTPLTLQNFVINLAEDVETAEVEEHVLILDKVLVKRPGYFSEGSLQLAHSLVGPRPLALRTFSILVKSFSIFRIGL